MPCWPYHSSCPACLRACRMVYADSLALLALALCNVPGGVQEAEQHSRRCLTIVEGISKETNRNAGQAFALPLPFPMPEPLP